MTVAAGAWRAMGWERLTSRAGRRRLPVCDCTSGLVAGDGAALLIDTGSTLRDGAELRDQAERLLGDGRAVTHVVLTHPHFDHVLGAAAFADAEIYGAAGLDTVLSGDRESLCADAVRHGVDPRDAAEAADVLGPPDRTVGEEVTLGLGGGLEVLLANVGPGHTGHDLAVLVPAVPGYPEIVFCGDLVEESGEPQAGPDAVPARWPAALDRLLALGGENALYVPGHGAVVDAAFVRRQRDTLAERFGA